MNFTRAFFLTKQLVVIATSSILASLLLPALQSANTDVTDVTLMYKNHFDQWCDRWGRHWSYWIDCILLPSSGNFLALYAPV